MTVQVFVTVGTSALTNNPDLYHNQSLPQLRERLQQPDIYNRLKSQLSDRLSANLADYGGPDDTRDFRRFTAELGSLLAMKRQELFDPDPANNRLILLYTDTKEGQLCAEVLEQVLASDSGRKNLPCRVKSHRIASLKVENTESFKEGLNNLKRIISGEIESRIPNIQKFFNITGCYKAIIPYATAIAWDYNMLLCYLYENSSELIMIPRPLETCVNIFSTLVETTQIKFSGPRRRTGSLAD